jgi:hypothetical protein
MQLIARKLGNDDKYDRLRCIRDDGSSTEVSMPRQGALPHDLIHAVVESRLGFSDGFMGLVGKGADIAFAAKEFHQYIDPRRHAQVAQAESVVESLQAQLWAGVFDADQFAYGVEVACAMRGVDVPAIANAVFSADLFAAVVEWGRQWHALPAQAEWRWRFPLDADAGPGARD